MKNLMTGWVRSFFQVGLCVMLGGLWTAQAPWALASQPSRDQARTSPSTNLEGIFWILQGMTRDGVTSTRYLLETPQGRHVQLSLTGNLSQLPPSGSRVRLMGSMTSSMTSSLQNPLPTSKIANVRVQDLALMAPPLAQSQSKEVAALPQALPQKERVLALLVNFKDQPQPYSKDFVMEGLAEMDRFYLENSYNQKGFEGTVVGNYDVPVFSSDACGTIMDNVIFSANAAATQAGVNLAQYPRRVYIFPYAPDCQYVGISTVNGGLTWLNQSRHPTVLAHELGHQLGLWHANALACGPSGPLAEPCSHIEAGDNSDTMGITVGHFNAFEKELLGWFNKPDAPQLQTVTQSGTYTLESYESATPNTKALKVLKSDQGNGNANYFYLECRNTTGFDQILPQVGDFTNGASVHLGNLSNTNSSYLLNIDSANSSFYNANLSIPGGRPTLTDPTAARGGVKITLVAKDQNHCTFNIVIGNEQPCTRSNPAVTVTPLTSQAVEPGKSMDYRVDVKNQDSSSCGGSLFNLAAGPVTGVSPSFGVNPLVLAPGESKSAILTAAVASTVADGRYSFPVSATNSAAADFSGFATASLPVQTPCVRLAPTLQVIPEGIRYVQPGQRLSSVLRVTNNDTLGCTTSEFKLNANPPTGTTVTLLPASVTVSPGKSFLLGFQVTASPSILSGIYSVKIVGTHSANPALTGFATASLGIQPCIRSRPQVTLDPSVQAGNPGSPLTYRVTVRNNNGASCSSAVFSLKAGVPQNFTSTLGSASLALASGGSGTVNLVITSPTNAGGGQNVVTAQATDNADYSSTTVATGLYTVVPTNCVRSRPRISLSPVIQAGARGSPLSYAISVTNLHSAGCPAATFSLKSGFPQTFTGALSVNSLTLDSGGSGSASMVITSPINATAGHNLVTAQATDTVDYTSTTVASGVYTVTP